MKKMTVNFYDFVDGAYVARNSKKMTQEELDAFLEKHNDELVDAGIGDYYFGTEDDEGDIDIKWSIEVII